MRKNLSTDQPANWQTKKGFTLIELLITTSIFSIIILTIYSTFNTGLLSSQRIEASLNTYQTARRIFNRMSLDLRSSFAFSSEETKFVGKNNEISFFTLVASNFSSVTYKLEDGKLLRIYKKNLESLKEQTTVRPRIMGKGIREISFTYAYPTEDENLYEWKEEWNQKDKLPLAVKIRLILVERFARQKEKREIDFYQTIFLPLAG